MFGFYIQLFQLQHLHSFIKVKLISLAFGYLGEKTNKNI